MTAARKKTAVHQIEADVQERIRRAESMQPAQLMLAKVSLGTYKRFEQLADKRRMTPERLASKVLEIVVRDDLFGAIMD